MALIVLGLLSGRTSLSAISKMGRLYGVGLAHALGFKRAKTPCKSRLSTLLKLLDGEAVEAALRDWVIARLPEEAEHLAMDGKTLKGSRG